MSLMTITQHALLHNFHTSNLIFEEIIFLKVLSMQPLPPAIATDASPFTFNTPLTEEMHAVKDNSEK